MDAKKLYQIYCEKHAKVREGKELSAYDYGNMENGALRKYDEFEMLALALGVDDAKNKIAPRSKSDLEHEIKKRISE